MSGKYFLQSGLRVLELLVKMDILYEDKDKIILNKPVAGDESMVEIWQSRQLKGEKAYVLSVDA